ncbi:MAG: DUF3426 domain-containing protein [Chromatiales bacterium]|nr:MAG: DUF3426 domain-containing protein [Chromatiales bacterium]
MYTQCPDCSTAFRVTADVLKQAAGKVRCGGCGNAFNALAYLSETMPEQQVAVEGDAVLPELKPEPAPGDGLPKSISAEQSAALLKTLDELAGSDIRIEDTGVEWRVLDDEEIGEAAADDPVAEPAAEAPGDPVVDLAADAAAYPVVDLPADEPAAEAAADDQIIDEFLDESPTPVDQFLTETPAVVDAPEIFEEPADEFTRTSVDEIRFDDNTPLPEDFALDDDGYVEGDFATGDLQPDPEPEEAVEDDPQADLDLSEPDEWNDILGEFADLAEAVAAPADVVIDALGEPDLADEPDAPQELELPDDDVAEALEAATEEVELEDVDLDNIDLEEPLDMDSQFAIQAEAMGIDLSGMHEALEAQQELPVEDDIDLDELLAGSNDEGIELEDLLDEDFVDEVDETHLDAVLEAVAEPEPEDATQLELIGGDEPRDEGTEARQDDLDDELAADLDEADDEGQEPDIVDEVEPDDRYDVPPMTEEEQTINMQIDQDLLALAVKDEDGFASTIVIAEADAEDKARKGKKSAKRSKGEEALKDTSAGFESIIMEGEAFSSAGDIDTTEADTAAAAETLASIDAAARESEDAVHTGHRRYGLIAGIILLVLVLGVQYVHQSRDTLATIPAFNNVIGPLYRALGKPLSPEWDITGWRFEATKGSTDEGDENLTIYSRVGNKSDKPLPYPLIGISLTDRFEETIGSRVLDPADYLTNDLDPRKLVEPGNTFNAVITIESPDVAAASFRLRACYRTADARLRCKDDGFK